MKLHLFLCPRWLTFTWWGCYSLCLWHKPTDLAHSFLFCSCVCFCLHGSFNRISFYKFLSQLFVFSLCSSSLISVLLALSAIYLFIKVSFSPDVIHCGWLGLKHQLSNLLYQRTASSDLYFCVTGSSVFLSPCSPIAILHHGGLANRVIVCCKWWWWRLCPCMWRFFYTGDCNF